MLVGKCVGLKDGGLVFEHASVPGEQKILLVSVGAFEGELVGFFEGNFVGDIVKGDTQKGQRKNGNVLE